MKIANYNSLDESPRLRILFVSHAYITDVNQAKLDAIAVTKKAEVALLVPNEWKSSAWNLRLQLEKPYPSIKVYPARILFSGRGGAYFYLPWEVWKAINDFQPDILHVEEEVFSICSLQFSIIARLLKKPLVVFGWENIDRSLPFFRQWVRQLVLATANLIIAGNHECKKLVQKWGYTGLIEVMPQLGVDTVLFAPRPREQNYTHFVVGYMGRFTDLKGIDVLLEAARHLRDRGHNFRVVLCGFGAYEETLRQESIKHNLTDIVIWRKEVPHAEVPNEMSNFDVLVLPSKTGATWKEQFGHVLIEAMCMGIPVVGSDSGEIPNVIGRSDLVFTEGDAEGLADILERLLLKPAWLQEVKQFGLTRVHKYYTNRGIANRLIPLWQTILGKRNVRFMEEVSQ